MAPAAMGNGREDKTCFLASHKVVNVKNSKHFGDFTWENQQKIFSKEFLFFPKSFLKAQVKFLEIPNFDITHWR